MGLEDTRNLRRDLANQAWSVESLLMTSDESDKINTQDWGWNITFHTVGLLSIMRQVFIFIFKFIVYAAFCSSRVAIPKTCWWHRLDNLNIWRVCFVPKDEMSYYWRNEWKQSVYVTVLAFATIGDVNICRSSSSGKKSFIQRTPIQLHRLKALFKLLLILLFYSKPWNIFSNEWLKATLCEYM